MNAVGVLIVHHDAAVRRGTRVVLAATPGFDAVGEAASAEEALELAVELRPRLVLVGADMPGIDGFETGQRLLASVPDTSIVLLHGAAEPNRDSVAASGAIAALSPEAVTPAFLRGLWEEHGTG